MAMKKSKTEASSKPTTAEAPQAPAEPTPAPKAAKRSTPKEAKAAADTAAKADTPKPDVKRPVPKAAPKKPAPVKLTDNQTNFLKQVHAAGDDGYKGDKKGDAKTLEALLGKKLIKKGAKDKASGAYKFMVSKAGEKHLGTPAS